MSASYAWKEVKSEGLMLPNVIYTKVRGGWLVMLKGCETLTFISDPEHVSEPLPA